MRNMISLSQFIGFLMLAHVSSAVQQIASVVGKSVTLECDLPRADPAHIKWVDWIHNSGREPQGIFDSENNANRDIDDSHPNKERMVVDEEYNLTIQNLKFGDSGDSGEYICMSIQGDKTEEKSFQLNIAGLPECSGNGDLVEGETAVFNCMTPFSGSDVPNLGWYLDGKLIDSDDMSEIGKAKQDYTIESASDLYDDKTMTCKMEFGKVTDECNIPVTVKYSVNKVDIMPTSEEVRAGEQVKCEANGNPSSKVKMVFSGAEVSETVEGNKYVTFNIPKEWEGKEVTVKCEGSNELDGQVKLLENTMTYNVEAPPTTTTTSTTTTTESTTTIKIDPKQEETKEPPKPQPTEKIAPVTPKAGAETDEKDLGPKSGGGNIVGIVAGVIIAALVIVVIVIAVACILRKSSKKHKGAKPVPTKEDDMKRMEDGKGVWNSSLAYSEAEKHGRYQQTHPFPPPSNGAIPIEGVFYHKDGSGDNAEGVDVGLVGSVDLDNNHHNNNRDSDTNLAALDTSSVNFTDVDYSQILHPQKSSTGSS